MLLAITIYLSCLPNRTASRHLSSTRLAKCIRNEGCFSFSQEIWRKTKKKHFQSVEIGNDIVIYINIKQEL